MKVKKVVLSYSGGLDTSIIIHWLKENYGCEVITFTGNIGQEDDLSGLKEKALHSGASKAYVEDLRREFIEEYIWPCLKAGAVYEGKYLLGTAMARPLLGKRQAEIAIKEGADAVSHGCTGKGNDQVRFELSYKAVAPAIKVIAPWRIWDIRSREEAINYAHAHDIKITVTKEKIFSRDSNIWHISHEGGPVEDPAWQPTEDIYQWTNSPEQAPDKPAYIEIGFEQGIPVAVNGLRMGSVELMEEVNKIGKENAIGRIDMVENRLVGIKSRGLYETPGGTILYTAHHDLEAICLDRDTLHFKEHVGLKYAEMVYYGFWFTPLRQALDAFVDSTQKRVTGRVRLKLYKGNASVVARQSDYSLYSNELASFCMEESYKPQDAEGFINLLGLPITMGACLEDKYVNVGR